MIFCARHFVFRGFGQYSWDRHGHWRFAAGPGLLQNPAYRSGIATLCDMGFSLDLVVAPQQLVEVGDLAKAFPDLRIAVNHLGQVEPDVPETIADWEAGLYCIANHGNVTLKISGLWTIDRNWSADALRPFLSQALSYLGADRLMFGSNLPIEKLMVPVSSQIKVL